VATISAKLAKALSDIPCMPPVLIRRTIEGYYHGYRSGMQLIEDLRSVKVHPITPKDSRPMIQTLIERIKSGEFEEMSAYLDSEEGTKALQDLLQ
jgi:hypothetical protein